MSLDVIRRSQTDTLAEIFKNRANFLESLSQRFTSLEAVQAPTSALGALDATVDDGGGDPVSLSGLGDIEDRNDIIQFLSQTPVKSVTAARAWAEKNGGEYFNDTKLMQAYTDQIARELGIGTTLHIEQEIIDLPNADAKIVAVISTAGQFIREAYGEDAFEAYKANVQADWDDDGKLSPETSAELQLIFDNYALDHPDDLSGGAARIAQAYVAILRDRGDIGANQFVTDSQAIDALGSDGAFSNESLATDPQQDLISDLSNYHELKAEKDGLLAKLDGGELTQEEFDAQWSILSAEIFAMEANLADVAEAYGIPTEVLLDREMAMGFILGLQDPALAARLTKVADLDKQIADLDQQITKPVNRGTNFDERAELEQQHSELVAMRDAILGNPEALVDQLEAERAAIGQKLAELGNAGYEMGHPLTIPLMEQMDAISEEIEVVKAYAENPLPLPEESVRADMSVGIAAAQQVETSIAMPGPIRTTPDNIHETLQTLDDLKLQLAVLKELISVNGGDEALLARREDLQQQIAEYEIDVTRFATQQGIEPLALLSTDGVAVWKKHQRLATDSSYAAGYNLIDQLSPSDLAAVDNFIAVYEDTMADGIIDSNEAGLVMNAQVGMMLALSPLGIEGMGIGLEGDTASHSADEAYQILTGAFREGRKDRLAEIEQQKIDGPAAIKQQNIDSLMATDIHIVVQQLLELDLSPLDDAGPATMVGAVFSLLGLEVTDADVQSFIDDTPVSPHVGKAFVVAAQMFATSRGLVVDDITAVEQLRNALKDDLGQTTSAHGVDKWEEVVYVGTTDPYVGDATGATDGTEALRSFLSVGRTIIAETLGEEAAAALDAGSPPRFFDDAIEPWASTRAGTGRASDKTITTGEGYTLSAEHWNPETGAVFGFEDTPWVHTEWQFEVVLTRTEPNGPRGNSTYTSTETISRDDPEFDRKFAEAKADGYTVVRMEAVPRSEPERMLGRIQEALITAMADYVPEYNDDGTVSNPSPLVRMAQYFVQTQFSAENYTLDFADGGGAEKWRNPEIRETGIVVTDEVAVKRFLAALGVTDDNIEAAFGAAGGSLDAASSLDGANNSTQAQEITTMVLDEAFFGGLGGLVGMALGHMTDHPYTDFAQQQLGENGRSTQQANSKESASDPGTWGDVLLGFLMVGVPEVVGGAGAAARLVRGGLNAGEAVGDAIRTGARIADDVPGAIPATPISTGATPRTVLDAPAGPVGESVESPGSSAFDFAGVVDPNLGRGSSSPQSLGDDSSFVTAGGTEYGPPSVPTTLAPTGRLPDAPASAAPLPDSSDGSIGDTGSLPDSSEGSLGDTGSLPVSFPAGSTGAATPPARGPLEIEAAPPPAGDAPVTTSANGSVPSATSGSPALEDSGRGSGGEIGTVTEGGPVGLRPTSTQTRQTGIKVPEDAKFRDARRTLNEADDALRAHVDTYGDVGPTPEYLATKSKLEDDYKAAKKSISDLEEQTFYAYNEPTTSQAKTPLLEARERLSTARNVEVRAEDEWLQATIVHDANTELTTAETTLAEAEDALELALDNANEIKANPNSRPSDLNRQMAQADVTLAKDAVDDAKQAVQSAEAKLTTLGKTADVDSAAALKSAEAKLAEAQQATDAARDAVMKVTPSSVMMADNSQWYNNILPTFKDKTQATNSAEEVFRADSFYDTLTDEAKKQYNQGSPKRGSSRSVVEGAHTKFKTEYQNATTRLENATARRELAVSQTADAQTKLEKLDVLEAKLKNADGPVILTRSETDLLGYRRAAEPVDPGVAFDRLNERRATIVADQKDARGAQSMAEQDITDAKDAQEKAYDKYQKVVTAQGYGTGDGAPIGSGARNRKIAQERALFVVGATTVGSVVTGLSVALNRSGGDSEPETTRADPDSVKSFDVVGGGKYVDALSIDQNTGKLSFGSNAIKVFGAEEILEVSEVDASGYTIGSYRAEVTSEIVSQDFVMDDGFEPFSSTPSADSQYTITDADGNELEDGVDYIVDERTGVVTFLDVRGANNTGPAVGDEFIISARARDGDDVTVSLAKVVLQGSTK